MGRKKLKQTEVKENQLVAEGSTSGGTEKLDNLESKVDKLLQTIEAFEGRLQKQENCSKIVTCRQYYQHTDQ